MKRRFVMKNKLNLLGILGVLLVFMLFASGCSNPSTDEGDPPSTPLWNYLGADSFALSGGQRDLTLKAVQASGTGLIRLTVTGTVTGTQNFKDAYFDEETSIFDVSGFDDISIGDTTWLGLWNEPGPDVPREGKFATITIDFNSVFTAENESKILGIKQKNQALRYYEGWINNPKHSGLLEAEPTKPRRQDPTLWIPERTAQLPVRWKAYSNIPAGTSLSLLIWENADSKVINIEVTSWQNLGSDTAEDKNEDIATIVLDYSGVVFK
jgi:hypothetical protein